MDILYAIAISTLAGSATGLGALLTIVIGKQSDKILGFMLGFASGTMMVVAILILIVESVNLTNVIWAGFGFVLGALALLVVDTLLPHRDYALKNSHSQDQTSLKFKQEATSLKSGLLVALGITLHNFPEGLSVATGFAITPTLGIIIALAIACHNVPEGIAVAIPLHKAGLGKSKVFFITLLSGLSEPLAATISLLLLLQTNISIQALFLSFAGGAMIYLICDELIPQAKSESEGNHEHLPTIGLVLGFLIILILIA